MGIKFVIASGILTFLSLSTVVASPLGITQLVVFGDSLSDTGNAAFGTAGILPGPLTNYAPGEFTDGPITLPSTHGPLGIWVDQIAPKLGVSVPQPAFAKAGATDYAVGGALTGTNPKFPGLLQQPYVDQQVGAFLAAGRNHASSTALYSFWAGANDIDSNPTDLTVPGRAADDIMNNILAIAKAGGRDFLWFNLPPLGATPDALKQGAAAVALVNADSAAFNLEWQADLNKLDGMGLDVIGVDIFTLFNKIVSDSSTGCKIGTDPLCFANVTQPAQGKLGVNPNTFLFWDGLHPTTTGQALVANAALAAIDANAAPVPEPGTWALLVSGAVLLLASKFRGSRPGGSRN